MDKINTNNFDFLRVVFAMTVAISHLIELSQVQEFQSYKVFFNARLAIDGFFIISGFLIAKSFENSSSIYDYITRRIKRIVPAYLFVIICCAVGFFFVSSHAFLNYFGNWQFWKYLLANFTFQNYIEPCLPGVFQNNIHCAINGALWTIKIEEAFYLTVPILFWLVRTKKINIYLLAVIVYVASVLYFNYFVQADMYRIAKQLPGAMALFMSGIMLYKNFEFFTKRKHYLIFPCVCLFFLEHFVFGTNVLKPFAFSVIVFYIAYSFKFLNSFGKYGDFTYGIYIYHFPLIQLFFYLGLFEKYNPYLVSFVLLLFVVGFAALSWHFLELQFLSKNRKLRQKQLLLGIKAH